LNGIYNYFVYTSGEPERIVETKGGTVFHPEDAPGNPGRKESAAASWKIAGIGIILMVFSMVICIIEEVSQGVIGRLQLKTDRKQYLRKGR
jgi:hypothetical protein